MDAAASTSDRVHVQSGPKMKPWGFTGFTSAPLMKRCTNEAQYANANIEEYKNVKGKSSVSCTVFKELPHGPVSLDDTTAYLIRNTSEYMKKESENGENQ